MAAEPKLPIHCQPNQFAVHAKRVRHGRMSDEVFMPFGEYGAVDGWWRCFVSVRLTSLDTINWKAWGESKEQEPLV
jgi:hypothetical protein